MSSCASRGPKLRRCTSAPLVSALRTLHVLFLLAAQPQHAATLEAAIAEVVARWAGQIWSS
jgi:hypothetical protein